MIKVYRYADELRKRVGDRTNFKAICDGIRKKTGCGSTGESGTVDQNEQAERAQPEKQLPQFFHYRGPSAFF